MAENSFPVSPQRWTLVQRAVLVLLLVSGFGLGWASRIPELRMGEDEAIYLSLSHSIESGHYRDTFVPGAPPHSKYPPGFPVMIALVRKVAGPALDPILVVNLVLVLLGVFLAGDALRILGYPWLGVGAVAVLAWNRTLLTGAGEVFSDPLFTFCVAVALWATIHVERTSRKGWLVLAAAATLISFAVRSAGLPLVAAFAVWLAWRRNWAALLRYGVSATGVVMGWFTYVAFARGQTVETGYADDLAKGDSSIMGLVTRVASNGVHYVTRILPSALDLPVIEGVIFDNIAWLVLLVLCAVPGFVLLSRRFAAAAAFLLFSAAMLLLWPWPIDRLILPLTPWIVVTLLLGATEVGRLVPRLKPQSAGLLLAVMLSVFSFLGERREIRIVQACNNGVRFTRPGCASPEEQSLVAGALYIRDSLPGNAVIATGKPASINYFSERKGFPLRVMHDWDQPSDGAAQHVNLVTHILIARLLNSEKVAAPVLLKRCAHLKLLARFPPHGLLLEILQSPDSSSTACPALEQLAAGNPVSVAIRISTVSH